MEVPIMIRLYKVPVKVGILERPSGVWLYGGVKYDWDL